MLKLRMSSSDSEDDSFFNIAQKLSAMKNKFHVNDVEPVTQTNSVHEPVATTSPSKRNKSRSPMKSKRRKSVESDSSGSIDLDEFRSKYPPLEEPKSRGRGRGRGRGRKKKCVENSPNLADSQVFLPKRRKRSSANTDSSAVAENLVPPVTETSSRNRGRGRGRARGRGRGRNTSNMLSNVNFGDILSMIRSTDIMQAIATYSVGNTDEYPDQCDSQALFSQKKNDVVEVEDLNESLEDNEEFSVKVHWRNSDFFQFKIRKHQKLTVMFNFFAKEENVTHDKLLFTYQDRILREDDTPGGIDYSIAKFIEGGIVSQSVALLPSDTRENTDGIKLKFQCQNVKKPFEIYVKPEDKMSVAMMRCAEHLEKPVDRLRFEFDGDLISGKSTAQDLELEGGECIDVKILS